MPIYAYRCERCGHSQDVIQKFSDAPLKICTACGADAFAKQLTAPSFQLKGSGWYVTDFRDNGKPKGGKATDGKVTDGKADPASAPATEAGAGTGAASAVAGTEAKAADPKPSSSSGAAASGAASTSTAAAD
jgi:putative FmdB family regulatory protein